MIGKWCVVIILCCLANIISTRYIDEHINKRGTKRNLKAYRYGTISVKTDSMNRRQLIEKRFRNSHHYIIDREPVHIRHQKYVHLYPFPGKIQHTLSPLYRSLPFRNFDRFGYTPQSHRHFRPIMSGRHNHAFDQIFQGDDDDTEFVAEQPNGYKEAIEDERPSYAQMENGKGLQYMHLGMGAGEVMNHGYPTQVENVGTVSTLPAHDGVTENIVSDLSSGKDLTTVKGEDHVHVQQQEGGNKFSGWLSRPYTYEAHPGKGWGDYGQMNRDISPLNREFPVDVPSRRFQSIRRFPLGFNTDDEEIEELGGTSFNNYNAPIHGSVVSEKDAKKIGLYDSTYLKKLGIWDDTSSIWNSGLPWGMVGIPWGNSGLNNAWSQGLIDKNAELRAINKTSNKGNSEQVVEKACMIPTDIAFLFDASNSSSKKKEYFELFIEFAKQIVGYHQPSAEGYHYGAVYYSNDAQMKFDFEKSYEMNEIIMELDSLKNISLENETSNLEDGLRVTKEELFDKTAREWVYQILVVLTDSKGKGEVGQWAKQLRDSTVNIYAIGMANSESMADIGQMEKLGTRPYKHHVFQVNPDHLLGTSQTVSHPQHLARVIPNQLCRVNLIFLVDLSSNDTNKIEHMKKFIKETTADLGISEYGSHAAVISYGLPPRSHISNSTTTENKENWDLLSKLDHDSFVNAIDNLEDEATSVKNLGNALDLSLKYFTEESGEPVIATFWRYINVTIVMNTNKTIEVENEARNLRDHGVIIHAIDLGPKDSESPLSKVASSSQEFYLHRQDPSKLRVVAKRMRQYIYQLLFSQESETVKVKGGWEASYGNIMLDEEKYNLSHLPDSLHNNESTLLINNNNNKSSRIRSSNMSPNSTITPLIETLSQEPDWSKYIKTPTLEPSMIAVNKDDVELQDKVSEDSTSQSSRNKGTVTRQQINHQKEP